MAGKLCGGCGKLVCAHCGQCHTGMDCLWSAPACQTLLVVRSLSVDEQGVYQVLQRKIDHLQRMVAHEPQTFDELDNQRMEADVVTGVMLRVVAGLLPDVLRLSVERLLDCCETVWGLDRYWLIGGRDDGE